MAIIYFSYLFDSDAFQKKVKPIVTQSVKGNHQPLYELANRTMINKPELWQILENWFLGLPGEDEEDNLTPRKAITRICTQFLQPLTEKQFAWQFLRLGLALVGWSDCEIKLLLYGKSICDLLIDESSQTLRQDAFYEPSWCAGYLGWLDLKTIGKLEGKLRETQEEYRLLSMSPNVIKEKMQTTTEMTTDYYAEHLLQEYFDVMEILTTAIKAGKSIAMTEAW